MVGKADMLLANRTLSALIVVCLLASGFAGLLFAVGVPSARAASGNLVVTGTYTIEDIEQPVDGNVYVNAGGNLVIRNATLSIISNGAPAQRHSITVNSSGTLTLEHGIITTYLDQIDPWPYLTLNIVGGTLQASSASVLQFPGSIVITGSSSVTLTDTTVTGLPLDLVNEFVIGSGGSIIADDADDGPAISVADLSWLRLYDSSILNVPEYATASKSAANITMSDDANLLAISSYIGVDFGPLVNPTDWYVHNMLVLSGLSHAYLYGCSFEPYVGANADRGPAIESSVSGSGAYIYRWLNTSVGDGYGVPIVGATISATFTGSTEFGGQTAFYYVYGGSTSITPPTEVLDYLGETVLTYQTTKTDGLAIIPYLTDIIVDGMSSSALYVGSYDFTGSKTIGGTPYSATEAFSLKAYPAMDVSDRSSDFTVRLTGVSVESPNPARWLVVPVNETTPTLTIENMTYYHAGDVIVAANGTLSFIDSTFQLVQDFPNQRTITVDGTQALPARLEFHDTLMTSDMSINIVVQGYGVVEAWNTVFQGVNIIALGHSEVIFHNVTMNGNITTAWDSNAEIDVYDSNLLETITLSGYSVGGFTNTSVPSVQVEDDAVANIYRWIHVTVYDGAGYPCPGATVTASYFINGTVAAAGTSDSDGVARVRSTGTVITATGSSFWGNYKVNAFLSVHSQVYDADEEISVGVMPYTEPLGRNATYAVMSIPDALPDLTSVVVSADPANPRNHQETVLSATVYNTGAVAAHSVTADFYDETDTYKDQIGTGTVALIPVDGSAVISVLWTAHSPLAPKTHNISVIVDPLNTTPELDETTITGYSVIQVQNLPDVRVTSDPTEIYTIPTEVVVNTQVTIRAYVHNDGDATTGDVQVDFYDEPEGESRVLIVTATTSGIAWNHYAIVDVYWTPDVAGTHKIHVYVNGGNSGTHLFEEISFTNNEANRTMTVLTPANLVVSNLQFDPADSVPGGDLLTITATLRNTQLAPVTFVNVALYVGSTSTPAVDDYDITDRLADNGATTIMFVYQTDEVDVTTTLTFYIVANPTHLMPEEITYDDNTYSGTITVLDMRANLAVERSDITVYSGVTDVANAMFGKTVRIEVNVTNIGGKLASYFNISMGIRNMSFDGGGFYNHTFVDQAYNISASPLEHTIKIMYNWTIGLTVWADYEIWVFADSINQLGNISEPDEVNNWATAPFTISELQAEIQIIVASTEFTAGDDVYITATITYTDGTSAPVPNVPLVIFQLVHTTDHSDVVADSQTVPVNGTDGGTVTQYLTIPQDIESGSYDVVAVFLGKTYSSISTSPATLQISAEVSGGLFPWWVWVLIIVVVGAAIAGFTAYTYFYGLGKYVECGECGAFIPVASKRCPKCGVEFEAGTMKCSECGAWIPAESTECPNCGVKFVGEVEEDADYLERMKKEYDEMVSKYRELAKPELGKKFSDKAFDEWWRRQPGYISFDDWLAKEEEKKKEGPVPCPVCGTLNPKEATVCHKCGTVFGAQKEAPPKQGPPPGAAAQAQAPAEAAREAEAPPTTQAAPAAGAAPRMVIRRPIEKKVVPKKIIRTPTGQVVEEEPKEDNNQ